MKTQETAIQLTGKQAKQIVPPPTKAEIIEATAIAMAMADRARYDKERSEYDTKISTLNEESKVYCIKNADKAEYKKSYGYGGDLTVRLSESLQLRYNELNNQRILNPKTVGDFKSQLIEASKRLASSDTVKNLLEDETIREHLIKQGKKLIEQKDNSDALAI